MGLETIHPEALPRLDKRMRLADFDQAATRLLVAGIRVRAFVQVSAPFIPESEAVDWAVRSAEYAVNLGATHVSLIPTRGGNGALELLAAQGDFRPTSLTQLEDALDRTTVLGLDAVVTVDLWDQDRLAAPHCCRAARLARLTRINLSGQGERPVTCGQCGR